LIFDLNNKKLLNNLSESRNSLWVLFFFLLFAGLGLGIYRDYGISTDEFTQRGIGLTSLAYLANLFKLPFLLGNSSPLSNPTDVFLGQRDRDYGVVFELPAEFVIRILNITVDAEVYYFRHLLVFALFLCASFFFYRIAKNRYHDWRWGLLGALLLILSPRIFGDSFFNNKDLVFLSLFVVATYTLIQFIAKPTLASGFWHAFACALAIDTRLMAIILPATTVVAYAALTLRQELRGRVAVLCLTFYLFVLVVLVLAFWPWLWADPWVHFQTALHNFARFRHSIGMNFMGSIISSTNIPWYYVPVWIGVTTPITYLILFMVGVSATIFALKRSGKMVWRGQDELQDLLFLGLFIAPILAIIILHSVLYNGWRQMYFIYPAFVLVALRGFYCLWNWAQAKKVWRATLLIMLAGSLGSTGYWMVRWHPYQYLYFNPLAGEFAKRFDVDYWGVAYPSLINKILNQDSQKSYSLNNSIEGELSWGNWQLPYLNNIPLLSSDKQKRLINDRPEDCSDYVITTLIGKRQMYSQKKGFEQFDELKIDRQIVYTTYKRQVRLYEFFSPALGKVIAFSSPHTRCFLKKGWASTEDWGTWSLGKEAKLSLFMPNGTPKVLFLDVRALVVPKQTQQEIEIGINGQWQKKVFLTHFESNPIKLTIPASAYGKEWLEIDFKIPNAISPKTLGMGEDDRPLGLGIKNAVFE
jgi:hypothetical protein